MQDHDSVSDGILVREVKRFIWRSEVIALWAFRDDRAYLYARTMHNCEVDNRVDGVKLDG